MKAGTIKRQVGVTTCRICEVEPRHSKTSSYCLACNAAYMRAYFKTRIETNGVFVNKRKNYINDWRRRNMEQMRTHDQWDKG